MELRIIIGQGMGLAAVVMGFVCFQMKTHRKLLFCQAMTIVAFCLHYYLIGAKTGLVMNILGIARNAAYCRRDIKLLSDWKCPAFFAVVISIGGLMAWQGWCSLFAVLGVAIHTVCLSFSDPQKIRKSVLISSPLLLIYNVCVLSIGGAIYEATAIVSSIIGIVRHERENA